MKSVCGNLKPKNRRFACAFIHATECERKREKRKKKTAQAHLYVALPQMIYISRDGRDSTLKDSLVTFASLARAEGNVKRANIASASRFYNSLRVFSEAETTKK